MPFSVKAEQLKKICSNNSDPNGHFPDGHSRITLLWQGIFPMDAFGQENFCVHHIYLSRHCMATEFWSNDTSFGKRILIMKVKTKAIIKNISRYFDFNA